MVVLDTTVLIALQDGDDAAFQLMERYREAGDTLRVPAASWVEYVSAFPPTKLPQAIRALDQTTTFHPFGRAEAEAAARLQARLRRAGSPLSWSDLQVAATALHLGEHLVSNDRGFAAVEDIDWIRH